MNVIRFVCCTFGALALAGLTLWVGAQWAGLMLRALA